MASKKGRKSTDDPNPSAGQMLMYKDAGLNLRVRLDGETVWLTQQQMADLFQTTPQNITIHIQSIYDEGELAEEATCKDYLQVRHEGDGQRISSLSRPRNPSRQGTAMALQSPVSYPLPFQSDISIMQSVIHARSALSDRL